MALDEFLAWNLLSDPSLPHAVGSWNHGADSGGVLYYLLLWPVAYLTHGSVLAVRLCSALAYVLAGAVWWRVLSRWLASEYAALGIYLVWLSTGFLLAYVAQVRFYTPLLLFAAVATGATGSALQRQRLAPVTLLLVTMAHVCLVLIHMLGIVYSGLIIAVTLVFGADRRRSLIVSSAAAAGWVALITCRTAIANGSANAVTLLLPTFSQLVHYYLRWSASMPVLLLAFLGIAWIVHDWYGRADRSDVQAKVRRDEVFLCLAFLPAPLCLYLLCLLVRPLGAERYLIPYYLCLATACAYALLRLRSVAGQRYGTVVPAVAVLLIFVLHLRALRTLPRGPTLDTSQLRQVAHNRPVIVLDEQLFFRLQYYHSDRSLQFYYLVLPHRDHPSTLMAAVASRGYFPNSLQPADRFTQVYPEFLLISPPNSSLVPWIAQNASCRAQRLGVIPLDHGGEALYDVKGCRNL